MSSLLRFQAEDASMLGLVITGIRDGIIILYYIVVLVGFYKRWPIIYKLYLFQALLNVGIAIVAGIVLGSIGLEGVSIGGCLFLITVVQFFLVMNLGEDFRFDKHRILIKIDPNIYTGPNLLSRGGYYSQRKMWTLAALYFRQAAAQMPGSSKAYLALAFAYFNLKQFDKAELTLAEAKKIDPADPLVKELEADLQLKQLL
jgi:hypothetical protein